MILASFQLKTGQIREDHTSNQLFSLYDTLKELCKEKMHSLTSAQANHVTRSERHSLCACLTFSTGICAADPRSTAYIQYSLRMSRPFQRHVCRETSSCALRGISPAHFSMARHGARTCRSYIMLAYNEIQKALVCGPYFRVESTNKTCL